MDCDFACTLRVTGTTTSEMNRYGFGLRMGKSGERERDNTGCRVGPTIISSRARRTAGSGLGAHRRGLSTGERARWRCGVQVRVWWLSGISTGKWEPSWGPTACARPHLCFRTSEKVVGNGYGHTATRHDEVGVGPWPGHGWLAIQ
jgi:hypothetical protein